MIAETRWEYVTHSRWCKPETLPRKARRAIRVLERRAQTVGGVSPYIFAAHPPMFRNGHRYRILVEEIKEPASGLLSACGDAYYETESKEA